MKIAHLGPTTLPFNYPRGGAVQRRIRELAIQQAAAGHEVTIFSAEALDSEFSYQGVCVRGIACRWKNMVRDLEYLWRASRSIQKDEFDVLHFHSMVEAPLFFSRLGCPLVLSYDYFKFRRGHDSPFSRICRKSLSMFDALLPVSDYCRNESLNYWQLDPSKCVTVHNGVNTHQFSPNPSLRNTMRAKLGVSEENIVLLYVGRICEQKGTDLLLYAYRELKGRDNRFQLVIAGPSAQFGNSTLDSLGDRVRNESLYLGPLDEADLPGIYNACDIFVMPTREYEMFGMAAAEAQACGKAVVCSHHGGLPEVIGPQSGAYFETGDAVSLEHAVLDVAERLRTNRDLPEAARRNAARFAWGRIESELEIVYAATCRETALSPALAA